VSYILSIIPSIFLSFSFWSSYYYFLQYDDFYLMTGHLTNPFLDLNVLNWSWMSTNSMSDLDSILLNTSVITASSSIGLRLQVLYSNRPSFFNTCNPLINICTYNPCKPIPSLYDQNFHLFGIFLMAPSPLHGTSHNTLSYIYYWAGIYWPKWLTINIPQLLQFLYI